MENPDAPRGFLYQSINEGIANCEAVTGERPTVLYLPRSVFDALRSEIERLPATPIDARLSIADMTFNGLPVELQDD